MAIICPAVLSGGKKNGSASPSIKSGNGTFEQMSWVEVTPEVANPFKEKARLKTGLFSCSNQYAAFPFWLAWFNFDLNIRSKSTHKVQKPLERKALKSSSQKL